MAGTGINVATVPPEAQLMPQDQTPRDNQQIQDDNFSSGESVNSRQTSGDAQQPTRIDSSSEMRDTDRPNQAANKEKAEGSRENATDDAGGISNRPLSEEEGGQERLPRRGEAKDGSHA
jgi:hypothetical protein